MNTEFNWWLLIVGLVVGAGLVWLVLADTRRREVDVLDDERDGEAHWIASTLTNSGRSTDHDTVLEVLELHAAYLAGPPPDDLPADDVLREPLEPIALDGEGGDRHPSDRGSVESELLGRR